MTDSEKREYLHKILDLIIDINGFEARAQDKTGHKPTVILKLYGHVSEIDVDVFTEGWDHYDKAPCESIAIPLDHLPYKWGSKQYDLAEAVAKLEVLRDELGCNDGRV